MNYKVKSLLYFFVFMLSVLLYYQMDQKQDVATSQPSVELSMEQVTQDTEQQAAL